MRLQRFTIASSAAVVLMLGIGCLAAVAAQPAAQQHSSRLVRPAVAQVATPAPLQVMPAAQVVIDESVPATNLAPSADATATPAAVRKVDCIVYDTDRESRRMFACNPTVNLVMVTQNPADHCLYEIPLCVPACCTGEPIVSSRCGLFGRGVVEYCWPCGFRAIVKFRNIGDVRVDYEGD